MKTTKNRRFKEVTPKGNLSLQFQTPEKVGFYMATLIPHWAVTLLEPTPGEGNLVRAIRHRSTKYKIRAPKNFFTMKKGRFDCVVMNPPYSEKYVHGLPANYPEKGMRVGYDILLQCMEMSNNVIALVPWFTLTDSDVRLKQLKDFGLVSVTTLPRKTFNYSRIQTCVIHLQKDYKQETVFKTFNYA